MDQYYSWDRYFMTIAYLVGMKSKDPSTRVGAVIVTSDNEIISTGYNGLPRNVHDKSVRYTNKDYKYLSLNHAEENAILHCAKNGISVKGSSMFTPWIPCARCTKSIIQVGITQIIYDTSFPGNDIKNQDNNWAQSINISVELLAEANIGIRKFTGKLISITGLYKGKEFYLS